LRLISTLRPNLHKFLNKEKFPHNYKRKKSVYIYIKKLYMWNLEFPIDTLKDVKHSSNKKHPHVQIVVIIITNTK